MKKENLEIRQEESKVCENFVTGIFEICKKYNLDFPQELEKVCIVVTASVLQNTREEEK